MSQPPRGVRLPTDGLTGWGEAARRVGEGFSAILSGTARVLQDRAQVTAAGELAGFSERLKAIEKETREELADQDVQDWGYAWQNASAPKLAEAVNELSPASRQAGQELAAAYNAKASLAAQRDYELNKISRARSQWRSQLDHAVQEGDAQQAREWLEAGQGIFVPKESLRSENESVESRANYSRWKKKLQESPLVTLSELSAAQPQELPQQQTDAQQLAHARKLAARSARQQVLSNLISCMEGGVSPEPEYLQMAVNAGVLRREQVSALPQRSAVAPSPASRRDWLRRVDECDDGDDAAEELMLHIVTADMPTKDRKELLDRAELSRRLPVQDRRYVSHNLWSMYHDGLFGCPADDAAQQCFADLQQGCLARLEKGGRRSAEEWVRELRENADCWVCFENDNII